MELDEEEYHVMEIADVSLDEGYLQSDLLKELYEQDGDTLLKWAQKIIPDKEEIQNLKKELSKITSQTKEVFYKEVYRKMCLLIEEVSQGKRTLRSLIDKSFFQFIFTFDRPPNSLFQNMFQSLFSLIKIADSTKDFADILKPIAKASKSIDKKDQLAKQLYQLIFPQNIEGNSEFKISSIISDETKSNNISEQVAFIRVYIIDFLSKCQTIQYKTSEDQLQQALKIIQAKPYNRVLEFILKNQKIHPYCKKVKQGILNFEFSVKEGKSYYNFPQLTIHEALKVPNSIERAISNYDDRVMKLIKKDCLIIEGDKLYFKFTLQMLQSIENSLKLQGGAFVSQYFNDILELLKIFKENLDKKLVSISQMQEQGKQETAESVFTYIAHFYIKYFMKYEREREISMQQMSQSFNQTVINDLLKLCLEWMAKYQEKEFSKNFAEDVVSIMAHLFYRNEFQYLVHYTSETSKLLVKILVNMKEYPFKWKRLRKIKAIIDRWGDTLTENCEYFPIIAKKFFETYFDARVFVKSKSKAIFNPMFPSRAYIRMFGIETSKKVLNLLENDLRVQTEMERSQKELSNINQILYKMSFLYSARIRLPDNDKVADLLYRLYQYHASELPVIYNFRTWIINYSNISKDDGSFKGAEQLSAKISKNIEQFVKLAQGISVADLLNPIGLLNDPSLKLMVKDMNFLINTLELKFLKQKYNGQMYSQIINILQNLSKLMGFLSQKVSSQLSKNTENSKKKLQSMQLCKSQCLYDDLLHIQNSLAMVIRFYSCNIAKVIEGRDQINFIKSLSNLVKSFSDKQNTTAININLANLILGIERPPGGSHFEKVQILKASMQRYGDENYEQFHMENDQYIPFSIVSVIYDNIRQEYSSIVKNLLSLMSNNNLKQYIRIQDKSLGNILKRMNNEEKYKADMDIKFNIEVKNLIRYLVTPAINIHGPCFFNGKYQEKGKEDQALGLLYDQFQEIFTQLNAKEVSTLQGEIQNFLDACKSKERKVVQKQLGAANRPGQPQMRNNNNPRILEAVYQQMMLMGISRQEAEIAVQNIDHPDPELALDWIQANTERMGQLVTRRIIERSKQQVQNPPKKMEMLEKGKQIRTMNYQEFTKAVNKGTKKLIKLLVPELFGQIGEKVKSLIFICLDSFKDEKFKNDKYGEFADKIYRELDQLNKEFDLTKLGIIVGSLEIIIQSRKVIIPEMHDKAITVKLMSFMDRVDQPTGQKIISVINQTLPEPSENTTQLMKEYLHYVADILLNSKIKSSSQSEILLKMTKSKDQELNKKVLQIVCKGLADKCLKQGLFSLISIVLNADHQFSSTNIEFDIKSFLLENHNIDNKENIMQVETKKFAMSFLKFQDNPLLSDVCKLLFLKKKGRPIFFYDKQKHNFFESQIINAPFLSYDLPMTQKIVICSLVNLIVETVDLEQRSQYIRQLYKTLQFYKILIPYCMRVNVNGITFFQWLLEQHFPEGKGSVICFLTFLFVRNGLYLNNQFTFSDYLFSKLAKKFIANEELQKSKWIKIAILYFLQIKNFNKKSNICISQTDKSSLRSILQKNLDVSDPINYAISSECLYLIYKYQILESLSSKYKLSEQGQFTLEKQFINMDLFYTKKKQNQEGGSLSRIRGQDRRMLFDLGEEFDDDLGGDQEQMEALMTLRILRNLSRERTIVPTGLNTIFAPIQPPLGDQDRFNNGNGPILQVPQQNNQNDQVQKMGEEKPFEVKEKEQKMEQQVPEKRIYLNEIIDCFEKILPKITQAQIQYEITVPKFPGNSLKKEDLTENYKVTVKEPRTQLDQKFNKTNIFKERFNEIVEIIEPGCKWNIYEQKKQIADIRAQNINPSNPGSLRQYVLNRFMNGERERERRPDQRSQINVQRIIDELAEYVEPPKKVEELVQPPQKMDQEKKKPEQILPAQQNLIPQNPIQQNPIQQNLVQQNPMQQQNQQQVQIIQQQAQNPNQMDQQLPIIPAQNSNIMQQNPLIPQQNSSVPQQQGHMQEIQQNRMDQEPIVVPNNEENGPPPPHREILAMLGLPMTFLRDSGIDEELFDSLPQDMQIEQLNHFIQEQRRNNPPQNNNSGNGGQNPANQAMDIQSENVAFIASLDPQLRMQTLIEAGPEFLMTLPPEMRAEAENHRQRMIGRIIQNDELEEQEEMMDRHKSKKNLIYPQVCEEQFPNIDDEAAKQISKNILVRIQKFRVEGIKVLLQNKKTQKHTISTLISYIKNIQHVNLINCTFNKEKKEWVIDEMRPQGAVRQVFIKQVLDLINEHLVNCPYKDDKFLVGKYSYNNYFGKQIEINPDLEADKEGYYPLLELLEISIDNNHSGLSAELIKKIKSLPPLLCKKVVRAMRDDKFSQDFYMNMQGLSDNLQLKKWFLEEFPEQKPPRYSILTRTLKYNFSRLPYLKKMHGEALKNYKNNPNELNEFLNEIFRAYDVDDLQAIEQTLVQNKQTHFQVIKYLYSKGKFLDTEPLGIILKLPHLLDFETKRYIFQHNPKLVNKSRHRFVIEVNRSNLFHESFNQIMSRTTRELEGRVKVVFVDEPAEDAGGVKKQWFLCVSREIFDPRYALFEPSSSGSTYQPNPKSYVNPEHLNYFKFIGRFVAKALSQGMLIDAFFTRAFYKIILGQDLELKDLQQQDYNFYTSMCWLRDNKLNGDEYTFSYIYDYFGKMITKQLIPDGEKTWVQEENKQQYIQKYSLAIMRDSIAPQIQKFLQGFYEILPKQFISFFQAKELELLMSGLPTIDLEDLKNNIDYVGYQPTDDIIKWFWEILEEYTNEDLAKFIQFITGTSKIPLEGFAVIQGMNGIQKISIHKDCHTSQLPKSHTCFNQLDLPNYASKEIMKERFRVVLNWGSEGFGFM